MKCKAIDFVYKRLFKYYITLYIYIYNIYIFIYYTYVVRYLDSFQSLSDILRSILFQIICNLYLKTRKINIIDKN